MKTFTVKKCTESENGGYILTLSQNAGTRKAFGIELPIENRYCMKVPVEVPVGTTQELEDSEFTITQYDGGGLPYIRLVQ